MGNVRLMGERAKREKRKVTLEEELNSLWPTKSMCPKCRSEMGRWNESIVYDYLRWRYWPGNDFLVSEFQEVKQEKESNYTMITFFILCLICLKYIIQLYTRRKRRRLKEV